MSLSDIPARQAPVRIGLLLIDGFALMSYASVIEPFRAANSLGGERLYDWSHVSRDGRNAAASNGATLLADHGLDSPGNYDRVFVFAAGDPTAFRDEGCFAWLRQLARRGCGLIGVSGGPYLLARAGLLAGHRATIHWEHAPALREEFPDLALEPSLYVMDGRRMTCAGGTAGLDLALALIELDYGAMLAHRVGEWFIRTEARQAEHSQRSGLQDRYGTRNHRLLRMLAAMEGATEEPLSREDLAGKAGISLRQLERLCAGELSGTIAEVYLGIRLDRAAHLLRATGLPITDVAMACGFRSASHFSRRFRDRFGSPPSRRNRS